MAYVPAAFSLPQGQDAPLVPNFFGLIRNQAAAEAVFEAVLANKVYRRFDREKDTIFPGSGYVFHHATSRIARWTDGLNWSDSTHHTGVGGPMIYKQVALSEDGSRPLLPGGLRKKTARCAADHALHLVYYYYEEDSRHYPAHTYVAADATLTDVRAQWTACMQGCTRAVPLHPESLRALPASAPQSPSGASMPRPLFMGTPASDSEPPRKLTRSEQRKHARGIAVASVFGNNPAVLNPGFTSGSGRIPAPPPQGLRPAAASADSAAVARTAAISSMDHVVARFLHPQGSSGSVTVHDVAGVEPPTPPHQPAQIMLPAAWLASLPRPPPPPLMMYSHDRWVLYPPDTQTLLPALLPASIPAVVLLPPPPPPPQ